MSYEQVARYGRPVKKHGGARKFLGNKQVPSYLCSDKTKQRLYGNINVDAIRRGVEATAAKIMNNPSPKLAALKRAYGTAAGRENIVQKKVAAAKARRFNARDTLLDKARAAGFSQTAASFASAGSLADWNAVCLSSGGAASSSRAGSRVRRSRASYESFAGGPLSSLPNVQSRQALSHFVRNLEKGAKRSPMRSYAGKDGTCPPAKHLILRITDRQTGKVAFEFDINRLKTSTAYKYVNVRGKDGSLHRQKVAICRAKSIHRGSNILLGLMASGNAQAIGLAKMLQQQFGLPSPFDKVVVQSPAAFDQLLAKLNRKKNAKNSSFSYKTGTSPQGLQFAEFSSANRSGQKIHYMVYKMIPTTIEEQIQENAGKASGGRRSAAMLEEGLLI